MSTEIPEPAPQTPAADQSGDSGPAGPTAAGGDPAAGLGAPDGVWQQPPPAAPASAGLPRDLIRTAMRDLTALLSVTAVSALLSLAVGAMWVWLAPAALGTLTQGGVYYTSPESKEFIGQDGTLGVICAVTGLLMGIGVYFLTNRRGSVGAVVGLAGGGLLGGYLATIAAGKFGPGHGKTIQQMIVGMHDNTTFALPLQLRAVGMIWFWPLAAVLVYLLMVTFFGPLDPAPEPTPQWEPQAWPQPDSQQGPSQPDGQPWPGAGEQQEQAYPAPYEEPAPPFHNGFTPGPSAPPRPTEPGFGQEPGTGVGPDSALGPDEVDRRQ